MGIDNLAMQTTVFMPSWHRHFQTDQMGIMRKKLKSFVNKISDKSLRLVRGVALC